MQNAQENNFITLRLKDGDDFLSSIKEIIKLYKIHSAIILGAIGMLKEIELGFFKGKGKYSLINFKGPMELVSCQGNISSNINSKEEELIIHLHVALGDKGGKLYGGHFRSAKVHVATEMLIYKFEKLKLKRKLEEQTGLMGLYF
ncbi:MAG: DNA-binding protein [Armatimonadetes bacterium]|nr:DNA-binding protein [Armatimonadota bacterium]